MYKVCFNLEGKINGFDVDGNHFINLFNINDVEKDITIPTEVQVTDSVCRKYFSKINKDTGELCGSDYQTYDTSYLYQPLMYTVDTIQSIKLTVQPDKFTIDDLIKEKHLQLLKQFDCNDCICYEMMDGKFPLADVNVGTNIIGINANSEIITNKIDLSNNKQLYIYLESDCDIQIMYSNDNINWIKFENKIFDYVDNSIYIKLAANQNVNIYSFAILIK